MPRPKRNKSNGIKTTDGRKHNKKLPSKVESRGGLTKSPAQLNSAKKKRSSIYAVNALKSVFGSEAAAWEHVAEMAKDSFNDRKLIFDHAYGKPTDSSNEQEGGQTQAPIINFISTDSGASEEKFIDISAEEVDEEETDSTD